MIDRRYSSASAQQRALAGQLEPWLYGYLQAGEWANPGLVEGLQRQQRWWFGPVEVNLRSLQRACGPEPAMEYPDSSDSWEQQVGRLVEELTDPLMTAPLIIEYRSGIYSIRDGNHRHEAMRRKGWPLCWVVVWHNSAREYEEGLAAIKRISARE